MRPSISEFYALFNSIYDQIREGQFDLFMSHVWSEKPFLCQIYKILQLAGFRVWYDQNDMGVDTQRSMREGIERSSVPDRSKFLDYARGSCGEFRTQAPVGAKAGLLEPALAEEWIAASRTLSAMIQGLIRSLKTAH